jgi:signal transduction histidine kinase
MNASDVAPGSAPGGPADELASLLAIHQAITRNLDPNAILQLIADDARRLTAAREAVVFLIDGAEMVVAVASGEGRGPGIVGTRLPLPGSLVELAIRSGRALTVADAQADPHVRADPARLALIERAGAQGLLLVPLIAGDRPIGAISISGKSTRVFTTEDEQTLTMMASSAVIGLENARLYRQGQEQARAAAVLEERARLARELHDSVTQALYSLTLFAEAGQHQAELGHVERVEAHMARIGETAQQALKEMRLLVYQLRPPTLDQQGLAGALRQRLDAVERRAGVNARLLVEDPQLELEGTPKLPPAVEEGLYWIAQEALNNSLKHAAASTVTVHLCLERSRAGLCIEDDGRGFDPQALRDRGGLGLTSMAERAAGIGAALDVSSAPGSGTVVKVEVPL